MADREGLLARELYEAIHCGPNCRECGGRAWNWFIGCQRRASEAIIAESTNGFRDDLIALRARAQMEITNAKS